MNQDEARQAAAPETARLLLGRVGDPAEVAAAIVHLALDATYSSGLASGFADTQTLPHTFQLNAGAERTFDLGHGVPLSLRLTVLNVLDRVNEIRSAEGIGIFQAAYGPRRTLLGTLTVRF